MKRLVLATGVLSLVAAAVPALAADEPEVHEPCAAPTGAHVLTPGAPGFDEAVETPLGALNALGPTEVGDFYVDLGGLPLTKRADIDFVLSFDNELADYDLVTAGENDLSTDAPEFKTVSVQHCSPLPVAVEVFVGLPVDTVRLEAVAKPR
jgi:hypothetical protein